MSVLLARIHENLCKVVGCSRERVPDSDVCGEDLNAKWRNELDRQPDGTYVRRRAFAARDLTGSVRGVA